MEGARRGGPAAFPQPGESVAVSGELRRVCHPGVPQPGSAKATLYATCPRLRGSTAAFGCAVPKTPLVARPRFDLQDTKNSSLPSEQSRSSRYPHGACGSTNQPGPAQPQSCCMKIFAEDKQFGI